jgi:carbon monoxide dehydrogenase subunit G
MASIRREFALSASPDTVWAAIRDVGAVHTRLAPGFVVDCRLDGPERLVTFANGLAARELIVDVDEAARRLAYAARSERLKHHGASFQVFQDGAGCRIVWIADFLPHEAAGAVAKMMDVGVAAMRKALDTHSRPS